MADYRAINRNSKAVEQRKKLASTFSTPAAKFTPSGRPGVVSTPKPVFGDTFAKVMLGPDKKYFGGVSGPISGATGAEDLVNRIVRNMTVDTGDAVSRIKQDTFMGGKGKSGLQDYPLVDPNSFLGNVLASAGPMGTAMNYASGNLINNPDVTQSLAPGDVIGPRRLITGGLRLAAPYAKPLIPAVTSKVGKAVAAGTAAVGGFGAADPDNAMAMNPAPIIKGALKNRGILNTVFEDLSKEIKDHLAAAASKQNHYTARALKKKTGKAINKDEWFDNGVGLTAKDMWDETTSFFKNSGEFADEAGQFTDDGLALAEKLFSGGRAKSLQVAHIIPLEDARNAIEPFIAQGPGKSILTWPRVNRGMGSENMLDWLRQQPVEQIDTTRSILKQLGIIN